MMKSRLVRNIVGAALALLILAPVPALALNFLGSWRYFSSVTPTGGSVPGSFQSSNDTPGYDLTIGMGNVQPPSNITKFSVTATRDFQITNFSELFQVTHSFGTFIRDGSINVTLTVQRYGVANDPYNFPPYSFVAPASAPPGSFAGLDNFGRLGRLTQGLYRLSLTITYMRTTGPNSGWNNSSPHVFTFAGF